MHTSRPVRKEGLDASYRAPGDWTLRSHSATQGNRYIRVQQGRSDIRGQAHKTPQIRRTYRFARAADKKPIVARSNFKALRRLLQLDQFLFRQEFVPPMNVPIAKRKLRVELCVLVMTDASLPSVQGTLQQISGINLEIRQRRPRRAEGGERRYRRAFAECAVRAQIEYECLSSGDGALHQLIDGCSNARIRSDIQRKLTDDRQLRRIHESSPWVKCIPCTLADASSFHESKDGPSRPAAVRGVHALIPKNRFAPDSRKQMTVV